MLIKLYDLKQKPELYEDLKKQGIHIKRAMPADRNRVLQFVQANFGDGWAHDCEDTFSNHPVSCRIAVLEKHVVGFACYDVAAKNMFGPIGVFEKYRGKHIGEALLLACLLSMENDGYAYAVAGWVDEAKKFFEKTVGATAIEGSCPGIFRNLIVME